MRAIRIEPRRCLCGAALLAALTTCGDPARAATSGLPLGVTAATATATIGLPAGTATATATATEVPPATNTREPTFALVDEGGCVVSAASAAGSLPLLVAPFVLWRARRRHGR